MFLLNRCRLEICSAFCREKACRWMAESYLGKPRSSGCDDCESLPVDKTVGDEVSSGTVNQFGAFEMEATKVGEDSSIQRMIRLVQSADAGKAKIVGLADRLGNLDRCDRLECRSHHWLITGRSSVP